MAEPSPVPPLPQQAIASVLDIILGVLPVLEKGSGRYGEAEASLVNPCASPSPWLVDQVNRDTDPVDACADAEQLALILRGRFQKVAERHGFDGGLLANIILHPSPWRAQAQRCGAAQLPPDVLIREAAALFAWSLTVATRRGIL